MIKPCPPLVEEPSDGREPWIENGSAEKDRARTGAAEAKAVDQPEWITRGLRPGPCLRADCQLRRVHLEKAADVPLELREGRHPERRPVPADLDQPRALPFTFFEHVLQLGHGFRRDQRGVVAGQRCEEGRPLVVPKAEGGGNPGRPVRASVPEGCRFARRTGDDIEP